MPSKKNGKCYSLTPGKMYDIEERRYDMKNSCYNRVTYNGIFVKYWYDWICKQHCIFQINDSRYRIAIPSNSMKVKLSISPLTAKQVARGLCDRIPEDCAGIIERLLVGDKIVGKGPDRYAERC